MIGEEKMKNDNVSTTGIGFFGLLQILFIALKLMGYIQWEWWKVLLPTIIEISIIALILLVVIIAALLESL